MNNKLIRSLPLHPAPLEIYSLLVQLGAASNHTGLGQTAYGVHLAIQDPSRLTLVTKLIYPEVAKHYDVKYHTVERNIRSVSNKVWVKNPQLLSDIFGQTLLQRPTASNLLSILAIYFLNLSRGTILN